MFIVFSISFIFISYFNMKIFQLLSITSSNKKILYLYSPIIGITSGTIFYFYFKNVFFPNTLPLIYYMIGGGLFSLTSYFISLINENKEEELGIHKYFALHFLNTSNFLIWPLTIALIIFSQIEEFIESHKKEITKKDNLINNKNENLELMNENYERINELEIMIDSLKIELMKKTNEKENLNSDYNKLNLKYEETKKENYLLKNKNEYKNINTLDIVFN